MRLQIEINSPALVVGRFRGNVVQVNSRPGLQKIGLSQAQAKRKLNRAQNIKPDRLIASASNLSG